MVPSDELNSVWIPQLETREERDGLDAEEAAVDVVAWVDELREKNDVRTGLRVPSKQVTQSHRES